MRERVERLGDVKLLYEEGSEEGGFGWIFWLVNYVKFFIFQNLERHVYSHDGPVGNGQNPSGECALM